MSYIRWSTPMRRYSRDRRFTKISDTYAWADVDGYVYISSAGKRSRTGDGGPITVRLTHAEMRYMARQYFRQHRLRLPK